MEILERPVEVNYSFAFSFEEQFDEKSFLKYMLDNWTDSFIYAAVYAVVILSGTYFMKPRPRYNLRPVLAIWSTVLALFSIAGAWRTIPELVAAISNHSFQYSVCVPSFYHLTVTGFWAFMFTVSKVYELGDTVFIVLRKQRLIFLHWYHHITVLIYVWYSYTDHTAPGRWFMVMNYTVHSLMYTYYALKAMGFGIPRQISMGITVLQLTQMIIGCVINVFIYQVKGRGEFCQQSYENLRYSTMMYFSYFVLFAQFFYSAYMACHSQSNAKINDAKSD